MLKLIIWRDCRLVNSATFSLMLLKGHILINLVPWFLMWEKNECIFPDFGLIIRADILHYLRVQLLIYFSSSKDVSSYNTLSFLLCIRYFEY